MLLVAPARARADEQAGRAALRPLSVHAAYYGETLAHPGAVVGAEYELAGWGPRRALHHHGFTLGPNLGVYHHARNHTGVFLDAEAAYRMVLGPGLRLEVLGGLGYLHTLLDGDVYEAGADGQVRAVADRGRPALMVSGAVGVGWDFSARGVAPLSLYLRGGVFGQYPYNGAMLPHLVVQAGVSLPLGRLSRR